MGRLIGLLVVVVVVRRSCSVQNKHATFSFHDVDRGAREGEVHSLCLTRDAVVEFHEILRYRLKQDIQDDVVFIPTSCYIARI